VKGIIKNQIATEGASFTRMFAEEHPSEGNYFWLFSEDRQNVKYPDVVPSAPIFASNLGENLIKNGFSFSGYAEGLPGNDTRAVSVPAHCGVLVDCVYGRKHVPWISFAFFDSTNDGVNSSNLPFEDAFPADYARLLTVSFVIPNMVNDMHNGYGNESIKRGDN
jgi:hypothetical protein